ncbi:MAG: dynamin family protein [Fimbriimonadaceae bacterium]|nr:dynamin family protein [Fimbriimonadaceae bacterium]
MSQSSIAKRLLKYAAELDRLATDPRASSIVDQVHSWRRQFDRIQQESITRPDVRISIVGTTGAGKSSLINAVIGQRVLPVGSIQACTSAVVEVGYASPDYSAEIHFITWEQWQAEKALLLDDLTAAQEVDSEASSDGTRTAEAESAAAKLAHVYGFDPTKGPSLFTEEAFREPEDIAEMLNRGRIAFTVPAASKAKDAFVKELKTYVGSEGRYWPLVRSVRLNGPFEVLSDGVTLVDLPGLNDPNEERERITRQHLKACRYLWVVFKARLLTKDVVELLETGDFLREIVMDGRAGALTFIGTATDDVDPDAVCQELDLDPETPVAAIIASRNTRVRERLRVQLGELWNSLASKADFGDTADVAELKRRFLDSTVFTVSSKEYFRLTGQSKSPSGPMDSVNQTEIALLQRHLEATTADFGLESRDATCARQLDTLTKEIKREIAARRHAALHRKELSAGRRAEMERAVAAAREFLVQRLDAARDAVARDLDAAHRSLREHVQKATERGRTELGRTLQFWGALHWCTLKAIARRNGTYVSKTGQFDFARDLSRPMLDQLTFAWSQFFGDQLKRIVADDSSRLIQTVQDHAQRLRELLSATGAEVTLDVVDVAKGTREILTHHIDQIEVALLEHIRVVQRNLHEQVPARVRATLEPGFIKAADQKGQGMKQRMVDAIAGRAREAASDMFQDAEEALLAGVTALVQRIRHDHEHMEATVRRHAELNGQNFAGGFGDDVVERGQQEALFAAVDQLLLTVVAE